MSSTDPMEILRKIHDGVFLVDVERDEILDANERACDLLGYSRAELLQLGVSDIHPEEMDRLREFAETVEDEGDALASDLHCLRKDGSVIPIEASACTVDFRGTTALAVIVRDISDLRRQNHFMEVFDRVLRHNLRNRMNVVLGRAEVIEARADDEELVEQSELLCETVDDLIGLIDDVRTAQRSIQQVEEADYSVDSSTLLERVVAEARARYPDATITTDLPATLSVRADERLALAFEHVVENAIVHNENDHPNVEIIATPVAEHGHAEIKVIDDGPGIPTAERLTAANPEATSPLFHGSGLGLWIASILVTSFDGDLRIEDNQPTGTVVTFRLPRATSTVTSV